jgi:hypothetical protein
MVDARAGAKIYQFHVHINFSVRHLHHFTYLQQVQFVYALCLCYTMPIVMLCYAMLCYANAMLLLLLLLLLCYAMLCYAMLCYAMLCLCYTLHICLYFVHQVEAHGKQIFTQLKSWPLKNSGFSQEH